MSSLNKNDEVKKMPIEYVADEYDVVVVGAGHAGCEAA